MLLLSSEAMMSIFDLAARSRKILTRSANAAATTFELILDLQSHTVRSKYCDWTMHSRD